MAEVETDGDGVLRCLIPDEQRSETRMLSLEP
jgi:hypothetical protein